VQVKEKAKEAEESLPQTSSILYSANSVTSSFYLIRINETEFCWKKHQKMNRELTCMYIEKTNNKEL